MNFYSVQQTGTECNQKPHCTHLFLDIPESISYLKRFKCINLKIKNSKRRRKKQWMTHLMLERPTFSSKLSFLFKKRMKAVLTKYLLLQIESKSLKLSCMRLAVSSSTSTRSYSLNATKNIIEVTSSKQCIHFLRSERCPPTSKTRKLRSLTLKLISTMPVVLTLDRSMSCVDGK